MNRQLILHDLPESEVSTILGAPHDTDLMFAAAPEVKHCIGCFGCWVKTPGQCIIRDRCAITPALLASSSEMIIISRLAYGGFSPAVKAVLDRSIGYIMPYFRIVNDEMHHTMRYENPFKLSAHFYGEGFDPVEQDLARQLVAANSINLGAAEHEVVFHEHIQVLTETLS